MQTSVNEYEVLEYSIDNLKKIFINNSLANDSIISTKSHLAYLHRYFQDIDAKTILIEKDYVDKDFLDDFAAYYIRCFSDNYKKKSTRVHFFKNRFVYTDFEKFLQKEACLLENKQLVNNYLGFIVIKRLPSTIIGKTCLKTYSPNGESGKRIFPTTKNYKATLFGLELETNSLAFQEQDKVVSACATSAIWTVFNQTSRLFQHKLLSPVDITKAATKKLPNKIAKRTFPNDCLTIEQMIQGIQSVSLETFLIGANDEKTLKNFIYAYINYGIPIVLTLDLFYKLTGKSVDGSLHAITISGYCLGSRKNNDDFNLVSSNINKLYVHDDQVGPFAKMLFNDDTDMNKSLINNKLSLSTCFTLDDTSVGDIRAMPDTLIIPLHPKIRVSYDVIHKIIYSFNEFLELLRSFNLLEGDQFEWDIYLSDVNKIKKDILLSKKNKGNYYKNILLANMPRFIWKATALRNNDLIMSLLFDATDIEQGNLLFSIIEYKKSFFNSFQKIIKKHHRSFTEKYLNEPCKSIIDWILDR